MTIKKEEEEKKERKVKRGKEEVRLEWLEKRSMMAGQTCLSELDRRVFSNFVSFPVPCLAFLSFLLILGRRSHTQINFDLVKIVIPWTKVIFTLTGVDK